MELERLKKMREDLSDRAALRTLAYCSAWGRKNSKLPCEVFHMLPKFLQPYTLSHFFKKDGNDVSRVDTENALAGGAAGKWIPSLSQESAFAAIYALAGFTRIPSNTRYAAVTQSVSAQVVEEGGKIPVTGTLLDPQTTEPRKAGAITVITRELLEEADPAYAINFLGAELENGLARAIDAEFLASVIEDETPEIVYTGDLLADAATAAGFVSKSGAELFWVCSRVTAATISTLKDFNGAQLFPYMGLNGGELLDVPCLLTSSLEDGALVLLNAKDYAADLKKVEVETAEHATIDMSSLPTGANMVSMFQGNMVAVSGICSFSFEKMRENGAAMITDIVTVTPES